MVPADQVLRPLGTEWPTTLTVSGQTFTQEDSVYRTTSNSGGQVNYYRLKSTQPLPTPPPITDPDPNEDIPNQESQGSGGGSDEEFTQDGNTLNQE
jgi:hypothetical protein